jgi:hypothetical protein
MKLLICGDSFAADWTVKFTGVGWPNLLSKNYQVTNLAQAGCSEYKIYQQLVSVNLTHFDRIIISHTSPYRIPVKEHPVHANDKLHKNSDLIYTDIKEHSKTNKKLLPIVDFFEKYFDMDSAPFIHSLICKEIDHLTLSTPTLHLTNLNWENLYMFKNMLNFEFLFKTNRGILNHYDDEGNQIIYDLIVKRLQVP